MKKRRVSVAEKLKEEFYRGMRELKDRQERTAREIDRVNSEIDRVNSEIDRVNSEIDRVSSEIEKVNKMVGQLTDGWGKFVEGLVEPSIQLFKERGIEIDTVYQRPQVSKDGKTFELDLLAVGKMHKKDVVVVIEVKSDFRISDVKEWEEKLKKFFYFFPIYRNFQLVSVIAGVRFSKGVKEYAQEKGFYVLVPSGKSFSIWNKEGFKPKIYTAKM
jgi:sugar-specific transcriptional regulator TrmB